LRSATICFRRSVSVEFRRMLTVWAMTAGVSGFSCKGRFHQFSLNRPRTGSRIGLWPSSIRVAAFSILSAPKTQPWKLIQCVLLDRQRGYYGPSHKISDSPGFFSEPMRLKRRTGAW
jgi:hypothetical protein